MQRKITKGNMTLDEIISDNHVQANFNEIDKVRWKEVTNPVVSKATSRWFQQ